MKYPGGNAGNTNCNNATKRFNDQFETLLSLFEQWNDCERTVALYALLKRVPYSNLKFLQLSIEDNLSPMYTPQNKLHLLESNANNAIFLNKLVNKYKNFSTDTSVSQTKDTLLFDSITYGDKYEKKEDILSDVLAYLPLLKPGNEEAKQVYMNLIPLAVDDSVRQIVPTELVQQIFSYLLIHPAFSHDDRRSLSQWLRHLQEHISTGVAKHIQNGSGYSFLSSTDLQSPYLTSSTSSLSSASWQTIAPPSLSTGAPGSSSSQDASVASNATTPWDLHSIQVTQEFCDDLNEFAKSLNTSTTSNTALVNNTTSSHAAQKYDISTKDDLHVSFSKNGTEIEFDYDDFKSNTQIAFDLSGDFLTVPGGQWDPSAIKTRRSNSLTTSTTSSQNTCSSAENLSTIVQKPRSFSLSGESTRSNLTSHGSETRLDDMNKPNYVRYNSHNIGMSGIGQWLKSLRLHKYVWLFTHLTYEQMLDITEDYLENLGVTKGARHKLVLCILKLRDRAATLQQMEKELMAGIKQSHQVLEELTSIVVTPMKPVDMYNKDDVAALFVKVLDLISTVTAAKPVCSQQDEDTVNVILWLLERSLHNEAFMAQTNQLKEHKYKLNKMKSQFAPKGHYGKTSGSNGGKLRWSTNQKHKSGSSEGLKMHRKNSNTMQHFPQLHATTNSHNSSQGGGLQTSSNYYLTSNNNNYNKSSSYPNFMSNATSVLTNNTLNAVLNLANQQSQNTQTSNQQQQRNQHDQQTSQTVANVLNASLAYHTHSMNKLITVQQPLIMQQAVATVNPSVNENLSAITNNDAPATNTQQLSPSSSSIGDINSRLEFLCLQMTEQAIN